MGIIIFLANMIRPILFTLALLAAFDSTFSQVTPPPTVLKVDITKYAGRWFEIARLDIMGTTGCSCSEALYTLIDQKTVSVKNSCIKSGKLSQIEGLGYTLDQTNAKLQVKFPFNTGSYYILRLDPNYQWSLVSDKNRGSLFILSRTQRLDPVTLRNLVKYAQSLGYPVEKLVNRETYC
eukprot:TRINITY_DN546_c0_g2_i4.p2 TRINITY_DN546_c0_g2~~TRINITY_DN546_c0_g2_i4.p2  ORF type:complete len:179 (+),score=34.02 TRINITY_DN546_c0_g2_i4:126-662(+)